MDVAAMSGLEIMQAMAAGRIPRPSMAETVPVGDMVVEHGRITMTARADKRHLNPMGGVHGGFAATVLDTVTGCAVHSALEPGVSYGTVDLTVKMLRPVPQNEELIAEGHVVHVSASLAVSEGTIRSADGKLLASASATCFIKRPRA